MPWKEVWRRLQHAEATVKRCRAEREKARAHEQQTAVALLCTREAYARECGYRAEVEARLGWSTQWWGWVRREGGGGARGWPPPQAVGYRCSLPPPTAPRWKEGNDVEGVRGAGEGGGARLARFPSQGWMSRPCTHPVPPYRPPNALPTTEVAVPRSSGASPTGGVLACSGGCHRYVQAMSATQNSIHGQRTKVPRTPKKKVKKKNGSFDDDKDDVYRVGSSSRGGSFSAFCERGSSASSRRASSIWMGEHHTKAETERVPRKKSIPSTAKRRKKKRKASKRFDEETTYEAMQATTATENQNATRPATTSFLLPSSPHPSFYARDSDLLRALLKTKDELAMLQLEKRKTTLK